MNQRKGIKVGKFEWARKRAFEFLDAMFNEYMRIDLNTILKGNGSKNIRWSYEFVLFSIET
jgi:hypothetical protein